jgi:hypothetical protein
MRRILAITIAAGALAVAGCGGDSDTADRDEPAQTATPSATASPGAEDLAAEGLRFAEELANDPDVDLGALLDDAGARAQELIELARTDPAAALREANEWLAGSDAETARELLERLRDVINPD